MKQNKIHQNPKRTALTVLAILAFAAIAVGVTLGYEKLNEIWLEQCVIHDMESQVKISEGTMVKADVLAENFGLRLGANLALIDFKTRRDEILARIPNLKAIRVSRQLPDKVTITAEERIPIAKINLVGRRETSGKVVDDEGVVFICQRGTDSLPTIRERKEQCAAPGTRLTGRLNAALRLVIRARDAEFLSLGVLDVDVSKPDYLRATLGDYSIAKIAWEGMDDVATAESAKRLTQRLTNLRNAIRSQVAAGTRLWDATDPSGRIYADPKGNTP